MNGRKIAVKKSPYVKTFKQFIFSIHLPRSDLYFYSNGNFTFKFNFSSITLIARGGNFLFSLQLTVVIEVILKSVYFYFKPSLIIWEHSDFCIFREK